MDPTIALAAVLLVIIIHSAVVFRGEPYQRHGCRKRSRPVKPPLSLRDLAFSLAFPGALSERSDLRWFLKVPALTTFCATVYLGLFAIPIVACFDELSPLVILVPALWLETGLLDFIITSRARLASQSSYKCWKKKLAKGSLAQADSQSTRLASISRSEIRLEDPELWLGKRARSTSRASTPRFEHKYRQAARRLAGASAGIDRIVCERPTAGPAAGIMARLIRRPAW